MIRNIIAILVITFAATAAQAQESVTNGAIRVSMKAGLTSKAAAKAAIQARGYSDVKHLTSDRVGNWAAYAVRGGVEIAVILQPDGDIAEE